MTYQKDPITGVPIIGSGPKVEQPKSRGLTANCEIYDSEIPKIETVLEILSRRMEKGGFTMSEMSDEIAERFLKIGFVAVTNWYQPPPGSGFEVFPEITISDRTEAHEFDHDKQVHEVTNDVLQLGEGGVIKSDMDMLTKHLGHGH